ncbi:MAG: hypothetical protein HY017_25405 [Betaproteobacteria bacterium]|nr:hypothetical protein [Betaproteobacteria bacterium]
MVRSVVLSVALVCALTGCSTANVSARGGNFSSIGAPQAGTGATGGFAGVNIQGGSAAAVVVTTGALAAMMGAWRDAPYRRVVPEMLEGRAISEVDCTKPIENSSANLRCR